jgi:dUTP pyrophosphatase
MSEEIDKLKEKLFEAIDSNTSYSYDDFITDYSNNQTSTLSFDLDAFKQKINFVNTSDNPDPEYATEGSAGFDIRSSVDEILEPSEFKTIPTGLYFETPNNFELQVRPRSGLASRNGVTVLNAPGTIDSDYRGEIKVILINHGKKPFVIEKGDRIAQIVVAQTISPFVNLVKVEQISDNTQRSTGGFGSTGVK